MLGELFCKPPSGAHGCSRALPFSGELQFALTAQFLLPFHLVVEEGRLVEEVADFAALLVLFRGGEQPVLGLPGDEFADAGHGEDDLLHAPVQAHNLKRAGKETGVLLVPHLHHTYLLCHVTRNQPHTSSGKDL